MTYLVPLLVIFLIAIPSFVMAMRGYSERNTLLRLVMLGFTLRVILCILFFAIPSTRIFHEDAIGYEGGGMRLAAYWHGDGPFWEPFGVLNYGYYYFTGILYFLFGIYRLNASLFNAFMGCMAAIFLYRFGRELFVESVARRAMVFALFFPSMILWSSVAVKDTALLLLLVICMSSVAALRKRRSVPHLLLLVGSLAAILLIRFYMFYMTLLAIMVSLTLFSGRRSSRGVGNRLILLAVLGITAAVVAMRQEASVEWSNFDLDRVSSFRNGMAVSANSGWLGETDVSSPARALAFMPYGMTLVLFSPFPWQFTGLRPLLTLPEMIVWWSLTFAWLRGLRYAVSSRRPELTPVLAFTVIVTLGYSLVHGNVGVAFRQRSQVMIFLFLLAAVGQPIKRLRQQRLPARAVEAGWIAPEPATESTPASAPAWLSRVRGAPQHSN